MTIKKLFKRLQQEQFDVEHYDAVFVDGDGNVDYIEHANIDHENKRVIFTGDAPPEPDDEVIGEQ